MCCVNVKDEYYVEIKARSNQLDEIENSLRHLYRAPNGRRFYKLKTFKKVEIAPRQTVSINMGLRFVGPIQYTGVVTLNEEINQYTTILVRGADFQGMLIIQLYNFGPNKQKVSQGVPLFEVSYEKTYKKDRGRKETREHFIKMLKRAQMMKRYLSSFQTNCT